MATRRGAKYGKTVGIGKIGAKPKPKKKPKKKPNIGRAAGKRVTSGIPKKF